MMQDDIMIQFSGDGAENDIIVQFSGGWGKE